MGFPMKLICMIRGLLMVAALTAVGAVAANDDPRDRIHRYKLVKSNSAAMCQHMAGVYRKNFKHPWHQESQKWVDGDRYFGKLPSELFKAFDGVVQTPSDSYYLLLNFSPSSVEFDAVPWVEGRMKIHPYSSLSKERQQEFYPILVANIDVDNDGVNEYFIKLGFLASPPRNGLFGWGSAPIDAIRIYDGEAVKSADFSRLESRKHQENAALSNIFRTNASKTFIRPLKYQGRWYFHAYHTKWPEVETAHGLPSKESIEIFQIDRGGAEGAPRRMSMCLFDVSTMNKHGRR